jgi:hypothetical protein
VIHVESEQIQASDSWIFLALMPAPLIKAQFNFLLAACLVISLALEDVQGCSSYLMGSPCPTNMCSLEERISGSYIAEHHLASNVLSSVTRTCIHVTEKYKRQIKTNLILILQ